MELNDRIINNNYLVRQLLNIPDRHLTATVREENREYEYVISSFQRDKMEANNDDTMLYWTLNLGKCFKQTLNNQEVFTLWRM